MPERPREPAVHESFVRSAAARLYVRDVGAGLPVIVLHGGPDFDHEYLVPELDGLARRFRLVYYDQRGRGRSFSGEGPGDVSMATEIDDLDRVREWTRSGSVALLGHSWGGLLAMEYAIRHPGRVSHLILMNTAPASHAGVLSLRQELAARRTPGQAARMTDLASDPAYQAGELGPDAESYRIHFGTTLRRPEQLDRLVGRLRAGFTREGIVAARAIEHALYAETWSRDDYDLLPRLGGLRVPALVIHGEHDLVPLAVAREIAAAIPGSRLVQFAACGHFAYLEQPDRVCSSIARFLARG